MRTRVQSVLFALAVAGLLATSSFGQSMSSENDLHSAKVVSATGRVSVLRDSHQWALSVGDTVASQQTIITGPDGRAVFQVSDGSTYEVFPNSTVVFRKNMPNWRDLIDVFLGQVRVHIQKMGNIPNPNRVITPTAVISVRGTTFDVTVDDEGESTLVQVEEGLVEVQHALLPVGPGKLLSDGMELRVFKLQPLAQRFDKGSAIQRVFRAMLDAVNTAVIQTRVPGGKLPGGGGICSGCGVGDKGPPPPPPPPPPPLGH